MEKKNERTSEIKRERKKMENDKKITIHIIITLACMYEWMDGCEIVCLCGLKSSIKHIEQLMSADEQMNRKPFFDWN